MQGDYKMEGTVLFDNYNSGVCVDWDTHEFRNQLYQDIRQTSNIHVYMLNVMPSSGKLNFFGRT